MFKSLLQDRNRTVSRMIVFLFQGSMDYIFTLFFFSFLKKKEEKGLTYYTQEDFLNILPSLSFISPLRKRKEGKRAEKSLQVNRRIVEQLLLYTSGSWNPLT